MNCAFLLVESHKNRTSIMAFVSLERLSSWDPITSRLLPHFLEYSARVLFHRAAFGRWAWKSWKDDLFVSSFPIVEGNFNLQMLTHYDDRFLVIPLRTLIRVH